MNNSQVSLNNSGQFNDSFVMQPLNLKSTYTISNAHKNKQLSSISIPHFGSYEEYKLIHLVKQNEDSFYGLQKHHLVEMITIDPSSMVLQESDEFNQLLKKYSSHDIAFIVVTGKQKSGKSFFCDKILNLSSFKGNYFSNKNNCGINIWPVPFMKNDTCVFLTEVSGCQVGSEQYNALMSIALMIGSVVVYVNDFHSPDDVDSFQQNISSILSRTDIQSYNEKEIQPLLPSVLVNLMRSKPKESQTIGVGLSFQHIYHRQLPNAMSAKFKGKETDLTECSFFAKQFVNETYIKEVSSIHKNLLELTEEKSYSELFMNGNVASKLVSAIANKLNGRKKLMIKSIYDEIIKDLYASAYNYCVISYQKKLENYFDDEKAKNLQEMLEVFQLSKNSTLEEFNEFNLSKELFDEYHQKLLNHIEEKEQLILEINKHKTYTQLSSEFGDISGKGVAKTLKDKRSQLNHGRQLYLRDKAKELSGKGSNIVDLGVRSSIKDAKVQLQEKQAEYNKIKSSKKNQKQRYETIAKKYVTEEKELDKELKKLHEDIGILQKRRKSLREGDALKEMQEQKVQLNEKLSKRKDVLGKLKGEDEDKVMGQLMGENKIKIQKVKEKQKKIRQELNRLKNPEMVQKPPKSSSPQKNKP